MSESEIEKKLAILVRKLGGLCFKFVSPGNPGVPDRIIINTKGQTIYVELKTKIGVLSKRQKYQIDRMHKQGADVRVVSGWDEAEKLVLEVFEK